MSKAISGNADRPDFVSVRNYSDKPYYYGDRRMKDGKVQGEALAFAIPKAQGVDPTTGATVPGLNPRVPRPAWERAIKHRHIKAMVDRNVLVVGQGLPGLIRRLASCPGRLVFWRPKFAI